MWKRSESQTVWIKIGLAFLAFYIAEAILFWQGLALAWPLMQRIPLADPVIWPLGYWGLFAAAVYRLQRKTTSRCDRHAAVARYAVNLVRCAVFTACANRTWARVAVRMMGGPAACSCFFRG